jgi:hypothetical protein
MTCSPSSAPGGRYDGEGGPGSPDLVIDGTVNIDDLLLVLTNWG